MTPNPFSASCITGPVVSRRRVSTSLSARYGAGRGRRTGSSAASSAGSSRRGRWRCCSCPMYALRSRRHRGAPLWAYGFGALWGLGGLTFGLAVRYLGSHWVSRSRSGCATPSARSCRRSSVENSATSSRADRADHPARRGRVAGRDRGLRRGGRVEGARALGRQKHAAIPEFNFRKGMLVATFWGVMSACFAYGLAAGQPLADAARRQLISSGEANSGRTCRS